MVIDFPCLQGPVINHREGGGLQNGEIVSPKIFGPPPPQDQVKHFAPPSV